MIGDGPIRISVDEWIVMRKNPRFPAALIKRFRWHDGRDYYRCVTFALASEDRRLIGRFWTLEAANDAVRYEPPRPQRGLHAPVDNWA